MDAFTAAARADFISSQTGNTITEYARYIKETDNDRGRLSNADQKSATSEVDYSPCLAEMKKPLDIQRLQDGAGEEGRTPDLMLGKHTL
jgi:hypothetical protein